MAGGGVSTTVTVTYNGNSTDIQYNKETLCIKIPAHTEYTLSFGDAENEFAVTPPSQTFTSIAYYSRTLNYTYEYSDLGVWIVDINGKIQPSSTWTQGSNATGVAVITDTARLIVAPNNWFSTATSGTSSEYYNPWNGYRESYWAGGDDGEVFVDGCFNSIGGNIDPSTDFSGKQNTDAILNTITNAPAAKYCRAYSSGCKGVGEWYLPSFGEAEVINDNFDAIEDVLEIIAGDPISRNQHSNYIWTSSQYSNAKVHIISMQQINNSSWHNKFSCSSGNYRIKVLPICQL